MTNAFNYYSRSVVKLPSAKLMSLLWYVKQRFHGSPCLAYITPKQHTDNAFIDRVRLKTSNKNIKVNNLLFL